MTAPKAATNGVAQKPTADNSKTITTITPQSSTEQKPGTEQQERKEPETKPLQPISQRLKRFEELEKLIERRETLSDYLQDLTNFHIAPTGGANLQLRDSKGNTFAIAHPIIIGEMVSMAVNKLQAEILDIDSKIIL